MKTRFKSKIIRSQKHLKFIAGLPCIITGKVGECQAAHIREGGEGGMGLKPSDIRTLPMHFAEHERQHRFGDERKYWAQYGGLEKAVKTAQLLYENTGNRQKCEEIISMFKFLDKFPIDKE